MSFPPGTTLATLNPALGFTVSAGADSGVSVDIVGDVNGDGFADLVFGAPFGNEPGAAYLVLGGPNPTGEIVATFRGTTFSGSGGTGVSVSGIGDVNGDGIDDLLIGQNFLRASFAVVGDDEEWGRDLPVGGAYVVYGVAGSGPTGNFDLLGQEPASGFAIVGSDSFGRAGSAVAGIGDFNGDGYADLVIGAPRATLYDPVNGNNRDAGEAFVVFGRPGGYDQHLSAGDLQARGISLKHVDGTNGFKIQGLQGRDYLGSSVAGAGDINGDGFDDLIIGSGWGDAHVIFGTSGGIGALLDPATLNGANGFAITGFTSWGETHRPVAGIGDVNNDGFDDVWVGQRSGSGYIIFGKAGGFAESINVTSMLPAQGVAAGANATSAEGLGDINGDGYDDFIIGSGPSYDQAGSARVYFGGPAGVSSSFLFSGLPSGATGRDVGGGGDVNGDGIPDLVIGAPGVDAGGVVAVVYGYSTIGVTREGTPENDLLEGTGRNDVLRGLGADDTLIGFGGDDRLEGNDGADTLIGGEGNDVLDAGGTREGAANFLLGGPGSDTYIVRNATDVVGEAFFSPDHAGLDTDLDTIVSYADFWWDFYHVGEWHVIAEDNPHALSAMIGSLFGSAMDGNDKDNIIFTVGGENYIRPGDGVDWIALGNIEGFRGTDTLVLEKPSGAAPSWTVVYDFMPGEDRVDVFGLGLGSFAAIQNAGFDDGAGNSYYLLDGGSNILFLVGVTTGDVSAEDFIV